MARSHFSMTTAAIKTLRYAISGSEHCIMTELCLIIRGERNSVETKGTEISAAARRPGAQHTPRIARLGSRQPWAAPQLGFRRGNGVKPRATQATAGTGHGPEASRVALPRCRRHLWLSRGTLALPPPPGHPG